MFVPRVPGWNWSAGSVRTVAPSPIPAFVNGLVDVGHVEREAAARAAEALGYTEDLELRDTRPRAGWG